MKKLILALGLVSSLVASAQTFLCPSQVLCTNDGSKTTCTAGIGGPWIESPLSVVVIPANTSKTFPFSDATVNEMIQTFPQAGCNYTTGNGTFNQVILTTKYNLIGDVKAAGNNWQSYMNIAKNCTGSVGQCPFVEVATK